MPPAPPPAKKDSPDALGRTYHPGDPLPSPHVVEKDSHSAWALFEALQDGSHDDFPTTTREQLVPAAGKPKAAAGLKPVTMDEAMFEARRNNRVCPMPSHWARLHALLAQHGAGVPPPVSVQEWRGTSSLNKRLVLRNQVQWAAEHGALETFFTFVRDLPEDKWHHMGD